MVLVGPEKVIREESKGELSLRVRAYVIGQNVKHAEHVDVNSGKV